MCFKEPFGSISVVFASTITYVPLLRQYICIYVGNSFFLKQSWTNSFSPECGNSCVEGRDVKIVMLLQEEKDHGCMYPNIPAQISESTSDSHYPLSS